MKNIKVKHPKILCHRRHIIKSTLILSMFLLLASIQLNAQEVNYTFSVEEVTIKTIFNELKKKSDINFIYNNEEVKKCAPITLTVTKASIEEILRKALKNTHLSFKKEGSTIVIFPTDESSNSEQVPGLGLTQTVRGTIVDADSKMPLIGATIKIVNSQPLKATSADLSGEFRFNKVPVGRIDLQISYIGYEVKIIPNIVVNSGKEVVLNLDMQESIIKMDEVLIRPDKEKGKALNEMSLIGARSISPEESNRYAGPFNDPSRIVSNYSGVAASQDGSNDIIVRGNSPKYMQWRLEGVQITNPNHFADQNAVGGSGISALNNNLLATSDFYTGAFSPEYGDVLSGVYDIKLRAGNNEKMEGSAAIGILGTDLTLEGPLKKGYGGSFLFNYRYSTITLIKDLGLVDVDGVPKFQDAAFKFQLPSEKMGTFSIFGIAGLSGSKLEDVAIIDGWTEGDNPRPYDVAAQDYETQTYLLNTGVNHTIGLSDNSYLKTTLAYSIDGIQNDVFESKLLTVTDANGNIRIDTSEKALNYKARLKKTAYRGAVTYHNKIDAKNKIQVGTKYNIFTYNNKQSLLQDGFNSRTDLLNLDKNISTLRNFFAWKHRFNQDITMVMGFHNMNVLYNEKSTLEPRIAFNWKLSRKNTLSAGYGKHSNMESIHNYFAKVVQEDGTVIEPNQDLDLLKAHHFVLGLERRFSQNLLGKVEVYYQSLYNLPVENNDTSYYATINEGSDYRYVDLVNKGTGENYGIEFTLERFFTNDYYYLINASLYNSTYKSLKGVERNTQYNGNYLVNVLFGKEFKKLGKKKNQTLGLNAKLFYGGGKRFIPLLKDNNGNLAVDPKSNTYWDYEKAYEDKIEDIYQITLSTSYKWDKPKKTYELWFNLDNITDNKGKLSEYYDEEEPNSTGYTTQFGFFPNMMFRLYF